MNKKLLIGVLCVLVIGGVGAFVYLQNVPAGDNTPGAGKAMGIEQYIASNISTLSPEKEVLGGTFYVTDIEVDTNAGTGTVWYEDGHIALVADFTYSQEMEHGAITIHSFVVRE